MFILILIENQCLNKRSYFLRFFPVPIKCFQIGYYLLLSSVTILDRNYWQHIYLQIPDHWVHKLRWKWALQRWNWARCEKICHKEDGLGGTKAERTQGRPWPCPQKIIKAPCQKFPNRKSCWQEILFTRFP